MGKLIYNLLKITLILALPFLILVRGSVYLHENHLSMPYLVIAGAMIMTTFILFVYLIFIHGRITGKLGNPNRLARLSGLAFIMVLAYGIYGLIYISGANTKHEEVRREYTELHPILRLAISTIVFVDNDLIITDASRVKEDYRKMGLKTKNHSLHYRQKDGFVYAVDIRTNNRGFIRNFLLRSYFWIMGFNTLRHSGTSDHLHVSLKSHYYPKGI